MARPTKLTPETQQRICEAIGKGATLELAAAYGGIDYSTFARWQKSNGEFRDAVKSAEASAAARWLDLIEQAASDGNWQAAAWKLERRYPQSYGRTVHEQQHSGGINIRISRYQPRGRRADGGSGDRSED